MATRRSARKRGAAVKAKEPQIQDGSKEGKEEGGEEGEVRWEWEGDDGWTQYSATHSDDITAAFKSKKPCVILQVSPKVKLQVDFASMTQANTSTGWRRNVRYGHAPSGQWEWQDEHGKWSAYSPAVQRLLGACQTCGVSEWKIEAMGRQYKVEIGAGPSGLSVQTNVETGVQRKVRHSGADDSTGISQDSGSSTGETQTKGGGAKTRGKRKKSTEDETEGGVAKARGKRKKKDSPVEEKGEESEGGVAKGRSKKRAVKEEEGSSSAGASDATDGRVLVALKGTVPVDYECHQKVGKAHVFSEAGVHWDAMLNQTNLKNNNNKFYILQLLKEKDKNKYSVWFRWGRVGKAGQHSLTECGGDVEQAKSLFVKKFHDKTLNSWDDRENFVKQAGKYDLLSMDYDPKEETDAGDEEVDGGGASGDHTPPEPVTSKLDERVQALVELICDIQTMEDTVLEMKYDAKKAPLGKLTAEQVKSGYAALKAIEDCINRNDFGDNLVRACDQFYTRVPHVFGMKRPPLIRTKQDVKEKLALLETLGDIQVALKVLSGGDKTESPLDRHYKGLNCTLTPVDPEDPVFALVEKYVRQTHAPTHKQYRLEVMELFEVDRQEENFKDVGNRYLLWHGSRLSNWVGILSQGLRIAPPEAPVTGYMFGKGLYFADMCSKSTNYCFASRGKSEGLALLCEVSLGQSQDLLAANYTADRLPKGKFSTKGLGKVAPDPAQNHTLSDGCIVPLGTPVNTGVHNPSGYTLNYNEFIVYDTQQVKMKYLVKFKFHFS